jgi:hypothetical protein
MGCSTCGKITTTAPVPVTQSSQILVNDPTCTYTMDQLNNWSKILICCKDKMLYISLNISPSTLNQYLGIVLSALNYPTYPCYFKSQLDIIEDTIMMIQNTGQC